MCTNEHNLNHFKAKISTNTTRPKLNTNEVRFLKDVLLYLTQVCPLQELLVVWPLRTRPAHY